MRPTCATVLGLLLSLVAVLGLASPTGTASAPPAPSPATTSVAMFVPVMLPRDGDRVAPTARPTAPVVAVPPRVPASSGKGRRVVYSVPLQRVWLVDASGDHVRTHRVSGQLTQPEAGTYRVYSRSRHASSGVSPETMQYMVRFTYGENTGAPIGFHDIPRGHDGEYAQTVTQLGRPLSHGCVRQSRADARALWRFAPVGTKVVVVR